MLDPKLCDSDGIPSPKIVYKNSDNTRKMIDFHLERAKEAMLRGRCGRYVRDAADARLRLAFDGHGPHGRQSKTLGG